jgi:hypothetical protein
LSFGPRLWNHSFIEFRLTGVVDGPSPRLHGRAIIDAQPPRVLQDHCDGLAPFSELNGLS